jgi:hypothetical protein
VYAEVEEKKGKTFTIELSRSSIGFGPASFELFFDFFFLFYKQDYTNIVFLFISRKEKRFFYACLKILISGSYFHSLHQYEEERGGKKQEEVDVMKIMRLFSNSHSHMRPL